ncbi:MAG: undecaprenyl-diphosphate phosphatase, partial [Bacteroidales bacterium]|nr:undecaprenyl-diphosphate phosphatase [Bacteroidales bacterium]
MSALEALILGLIQGLTEFLPVSSSGHLEIGKALLGVEATDDLLFTVVVHGATVLSTLVVFWKEIVRLLKGLFRFRMNDETVYVLKLVVSMIPILIV